MPGPVALVDCNNFYASCERLFQPGLRGKPVVVLSNNDGCVIARECELHCGLHLADDTVIATLRDDELLLTHLNHVEEPIVLARTGYSALMSKDPCDCGAATARLGCLTPVRTRVRAASPGSTD